MRAIEKAISKLDSYLYTIKRDTEHGWYTLEIGIPTSWRYKSTDRIECEDLGGTEKMSLIKISPNEEFDGNISIDELIDFANQVVSSNKKIEKMRVEFEKKMESIREKLEEEYEKFEETIETIEENLYDSEDEGSKENTENPQTKKTKRKVKPKVESEEV